MIPRSRHTTVLVLAAVALGALPRGVDGATLRQSPARPYTLAGAEVLRLESGEVGDVFEVSVALPRSYETGERTYPLVLALDADLAFAATTQIARLMQLRGELPEFVLVGVGYGDLATALEKRRRDLTPTSNEGNPRCAAPGSCGGAGSFARFLAAELIPFLESRYRVDAVGRTLIGNSLGGLFGSWVLLHGPRVFDRYLLGSPTMGWDDRALLRDFGRPELDGPVDARVYVGVGGDEGAGVEAAADLVEAVRGLESADVTLSFDVFEGERHMSVQPMLVSRGLRVLFGTAPGGAARRDPR